MTSTSESSGTTSRSDARLVMTTVASREEAHRIAEALVAERLAGCVQLIANVHSVYRWEGAVESADEVQLIIKTRLPALDAVRRRVHELHSYVVPEFLVLEARCGSEAYQQWLMESVS